MMRNKIYLIIICLFLNCNSNQKKKGIEQKKPQLNRTELNGIWGLNNYFDKIITDKQIAKHRVKQPTWFAILLEIKNDSIKSYGSIMNLNYKLNYDTDTLAIFDSFGDMYALIKNRHRLLLTQLYSHGEVDSVKYFFTKRNNLKKLLVHQDSSYNLLNGQNEKIEGISRSITRYFNEKLISGTYTFNDKIIVFEKDGDLKNFNEYDKYEVRNYFGTLHPHKNLDVITLRNSENGTFKQFNWKFEKDKLILTDFINEIIVYKDKKEITDDFVLGKNRIVLKLESN